MALDTKTKYEQLPDFLKRAIDNEIKIATEEYCGGV